MTACTVGCRVRGQHATTCEDDCTGCLPRDADHGTICAGCHARLRRALTACPDLVTHLMALAEPSLTQWHDGTRAGTGEPPVPLNVHAISAADDLHAALAEWVRLVMVGRRVHGPSWAGSTVRPRSKRRTAQGDVVYDPARVVGVHNPDATRTVVQWLLPHTDWITQQDWASEMVTELARTVATLQHRYPTQDRPVYLPVPCPACGALTLVRDIPAWAGAPVHIACQLIECGHIVDESRYAWLTRLALETR